jgi:2-polyprenyl-3-methyl-5-hydroxy-6-metoxy-1,4-benzoquinol methylase
MPDSPKGRSHGAIERAEYTFDFNDGAAYERAMGVEPCGRAVFLQWLAPPANARWLDVGCGTGIFTRAELCSPAAVVGVDAAAAQSRKHRETGGGSSLI